MRYHIRSLLALLVVTAAVAGCSTADSPVTPRMVPQAATPTWARIKATDSMMVVTDHTFPDTAIALWRTMPLDKDITVSAVIGSAGGSIKIDGTGGKIDIPSGALSVPTTVTMTAKAGWAIAYEFGPHGTSFAKPVKVQQELKGTGAVKYPSILNGAYGGYFNVALDSAYVDKTKLRIHVKETQIAYPEANAAVLKFYIDHFSGYIVAIGRGGATEADSY